MCPNALSRPLHMVTQISTVLKLKRKYHWNRRGPADLVTPQTSAYPRFALAAQDMPALPPANNWFYRDLEGTVQGPFTEAQISDWHTAGYLPADLQMRTADEPDSAYVALSNLMTRDPNGEPPFRP